MSVNVFDNYIKMTKKKIISYTKLFLNNKYDSIFNDLLDSYIDIRYYNIYEKISTSMERNINFYVKNKSLQLIEENPQKKDIIKIMFGLFKYLIYLDDVKNIADLKVEDINNYLNNNKINVADLEKKLNNMIKENNYNNKEYLNLFESDNFNLNFIKTNIKKLEAIEINYDIKFPKLYSEYALSNAFNKGIVAENKMFIEYYMISLVILKNIINCNYDNNYLVDFDISIYEKRKKWNSMINIINNEAIKDHISFKIYYRDFVKNKDIIYDLIREGYNFAIIIDNSYKEDFTLDSRFTVFKYIIVSEIKNDYINRSKLVKL